MERLVSTLHDCWRFVVSFKVESPPILFFLEIILAMLGLFAYLDIVLGLDSQFLRKDSSNFHEFCSESAVQNGNIVILTKLSLSLLTTVVCPSFQLISFSGRYFGLFSLKVEPILVQFVLNHLLLWDDVIYSMVLWTLSLFFSLAVLEHHDQKQLKKGFLLACPSGEVGSNVAGKAWRQEQAHYHPHTGRSEREEDGEQWWGCRILKTGLEGCASYSEAAPLKGSLKTPKQHH